MLRLAFICGLCLVAGCIDDSLVRCGRLACPVGTVCTRGETCALPGDVAACDGLEDGVSCHATSGGTGTCEGGACKTGLCGNGSIDVGEVCDGAAGVDPTKGETCSADCLRIQVCGNAVVDPGEQCDDGNANPADGCDACRATTWNATTAVGMEVQATTTGLGNPRGLAIDGEGRVYVADSQNNRILRIETDGGATVIAGTGVPGYSGDGGLATSAQLDSPFAVAVDGVGNVFIADTTNHAVRKIDTVGTITTIAGLGPTLAGYSGDGGLAILSQLDTPNAVAIDGLGQVLIADTNNNAVRRIDLGGTITTIAGLGPSSPGYTGDGGQAALATLATPFGIAVDASGRIVIADSGNAVVRRIELDGTIDTIAGNGVAGYGGDGGAATAAQLGFPIGLAFEASGALLVADTGNQRVRVIATNGTIDTLAGTGTAGFAGDGGSAATAELSAAFGVAADPSGRVWIADTFNERLRRIDSMGIITTVAGNGTFGTGGDGGAATGASLANPFSVAFDTTGRIYIADNFNHRIRRVELDGTITTVAGIGSSGYSGDGGPATSAQLYNPNGVAVDAMGRIYIADTYNQVIRLVDTNGVISTIAGTYAAASFGGDGGPALAAKLDNPNGVAVDAAGHVYIADTYNHRIRRFDIGGNITTVAGNGAYGYSGDGGLATAATLSFAYDVAIDASGRVVFGDTSNNRVRRFTVGGNIATIAGNGTAGFTGDGGAATSAEISSPYGVAIDPQGRVLLTDDFNQRIRRIETNGNITTVAGNGTAGASGDAALATAAELAFPIGVACDGNGRIAIADTNNRLIRAVDATTGIITTAAGLVDPPNVGPVAVARLGDPQELALASNMTLSAGGSTGALEAIRGGSLQAVAGRYQQDVATAALAHFRSKFFGSIGGVAIDPASGLVYISETSANRLHVITQVDPNNASTWTIAPLAGDGTAGFAEGAALSAEFRGPTGLYLDTAANILYIADTGNHAIRALDLGTRTVSTYVNTSHALGYGGDMGPAASALLFRPTALARCPNGDLFIADTGNNRVRRITGGTIDTVLGDGVAASSGEGSPARTFPVDAPRGLACDTFGNLYVTSTTTVRMLPADDSHVIDGTGSVQTIYGKPPRASFPSSVTSCLTGVIAPDDKTLQVADACTGLLVQLARQ